MDKLVILAVDPGIKLGWALRIPHADIFESGVQIFDLKRGESPGMRWLSFRAWLEKIKTNGLKPDLVVFEMVHHRGGAATEIAHGFVTRLQEFSAKEQSEYFSVHSATLKKWATGSGRAEKKEMIAAAQLRTGRDIRDDNEADAILLLYYAQEHFSMKS